MNALQTALRTLTEWAIWLFETIGVVVLVAAGLRGFWGYLRQHPLTRLQLAKGMATGLEFKLGSEILRTVLVRGFGEILTVGAIILLRAALALLIHWEIRTEEAHITPKRPPDDEPPTD